MILFRAELETRHFTFEAIGDSAEEANQALVLGLMNHAAQFNLDPNWWSELMGDISVTQFILNAPALRDRQPIPDRHANAL